MSIKKDKIKLRIYKLYLKYGPEWSSFSEKLKINKEAIRSIFRNTDWDLFLEKQGLDKNKILREIGECKKEEEASYEGKVRELIDLRKTRIMELGEQRKINEHLSTIAKEELIWDKLSSAIYQVPKIVPKAVDSKYFKKSTKASPQEAFMLISDSHIGLSVIEEEVGGLGKYNVEKFRKRMNNYKERVIRITDLHRTTHPIDRINVCFLGDLVHGGNDAGKWGFLHTEQNVMDQIFEACSSFLELLIDLSQIFKKVKVYGIYGNHGRIAKKGIEKKFVNWDYFIYKWIEASLTNYSNIDFSIPRASFQIAESFSNKILLIHGDQARSWNSIPWYGLQRLESKYRSIMDGSKTVKKMWEEMEKRKIDQSSMEACEFACQYMKSFDYLVLGHFHTMGEIETPSGGRIIMNSSFIGGDDYSITDLVYNGVPAQKFFGVNHHGKTWSYDIELDRE
jgi:hypothetical protein